MHDGEPVGFTCQSFCAVSIDPPLASFSVMASSSSYPKLAAKGRVAISVLSEAQEHISAQFARTGADKWDGVDYQLTSDGNPVIKSALIWLDCEIVAEHEAGDHLIVVVRIREMSGPDEGDSGPLIFYRGRYASMRP